MRKTTNATDIDPTLSGEPGLATSADHLHEHRGLIDIQWYHGTDEVDARRLGSTPDVVFGPCRWVFDYEVSCLHGAQCLSRHNSLDLEEIKLLKTKGKIKSDVYGLNFEYPFTNKTLLPCMSLAYKILAPFISIPRHLRL
jgi:hypothetical protein